MAKKRNSPKIQTERTATRGENQWTAFSNRGGTSFSATGPTRAVAYRNLRKGIGKEGG